MCHMSFQQDGHKGSPYRAYVKSDFLPWQQKGFPISSLWLETKVQGPDSKWKYFVNCRGIHTCKTHQCVNFQWVKKQMMQLFDANQYTKTTLHLLKFCSPQAIWPSELEREKCYYHPYLLGETEGVCAISFLPWRVWHCLTQSSVNWGQDHGLTPPTDSQLLQSCDQSPPS